MSLLSRDFTRCCCLVSKGDRFTLLLGSCSGWPSGSGLVSGSDWYDLMARIGVVASSRVRLLLTSVRHAGPLSLKVFMSLFTVVSDISAFSVSWIFVNSFIFFLLPIGVA